MYYVIHSTLNGIIPLLDGKNLFMSGKLNLIIRKPAAIVATFGIISSLSEIANPPPEARVIDKIRFGLHFFLYNQVAWVLI